MDALIVLSPMGGWDKRIVPMLDHARREPRRELLVSRLEVAHHQFSAPPDNEADHVYVDVGDE